MSADRARVLVLLLPVIGALILISAWSLLSHPATHRFEFAFVLGCGFGMLLITLLFRIGRMSYAFTAGAGLAILGALLLERILVLFLSGYFDPQERSLFMPVLSALPMLYMMAFALLPVRRAERLALGLWLPMSILITVLSLRYWDEPARHGSLVTLWAGVWLGHGMYLLLFSLVGRRQQALVDRHVELAARDRALSEQASRSEARFRGLFDLAAVGINVTDESGRYLMVNSRMAEMLGYSREELLSMTLEDLAPEDDREGLCTQLQRMASGDADRFQMERRYRHKDGSIVCAEVHVREMEEPSPGQRRFLCVSVDITLRRRAEAQAAEDRRIRDFHFENTPLAVAEWDPQMRVRRWSPRAEQMFGWSEAEALGHCVEELRMVPADQIQARRERLARMFDNKQSHAVAVMQLLHRSGRALWVEVHNSIVRDADGQVQAVVSMVLDITESQQILHMLNESEARFRSIFNQAAVGIALLDAEGHWLNVNHKLCEILGYSLDELMQTDFQSITHPEDLDRDMEMVRALIAHEQDQYRMEKRYLRKDGRVLWAMLWVRRYDATDGTPTRFVSVVEDIDERKAAEERIQALTTSLELRVSERTAQLRDIIRAGQRRNEELTLITEMGGLLSAATDLGEAGQIVGRFLPRIFPLADGALYLGDRAGERFERETSWGDGRAGIASFDVHDCWALRRGTPHHVEGEPDALHCAHAHPDNWKHPHLCAPIHALGVPLGLIELAWGRTSDGWAPEIPLVRMVAEKVGLAFGNLRLREELSRQALVDPLTGLNNRRWLEDALRVRVARQSRTGEGFTVLMIDVDHFKSINDGYGHDAGDSALREIGVVLARAVRDGEAAARFGGEEFTVILDTVSPDEAQAAAERIREAVTTLRIRVQARELPPLTVSIGAALHPINGRDAAAVLESADQALYAAKRGGRNQVRMATHKH